MKQCNKVYLYKYEGNARKDEIEREIAKSKGQEVFDETKVSIKELQFLAMKAGLIK